MSRTFVIGVGMTKFERPGSRQWQYPDMGREAGQIALADAGVDYSQIEACVASYCYGAPTSGQKAVYELGLSGIPVFNVNNNCSSGSSALMLARSLVKSGMDCVMALGFEQMESGLTDKFPEKVSPIKRHIDHMSDLGAQPGIVRKGLNEITSDVIKMFAYAAREYSQKHPGVKFDDYVDIAHKNRQHGAQNPKCCFPCGATKESIAERRRMLCDPITVGMSAPTCDGGAAAIVCSEKFMRKHNLQNRGIEIAAQHMVTDLPSSFNTSFMDLAGVGMAKKAAEKVYKDSGLSSTDIDILEVHDCFSCNELFMYEAMGLADEGRAVELFRNGKWVTNKNGGKVYKMANKWVVNASGGLESKGHPIGATGLAQCTELVTQLRGEAGPRQVDGARNALQHNFGIGGAAVVTLYRKPADIVSQRVQARL